jgi:D-tyrosyl-tRNA(Tyr) deacylase
MVWIHYTCVMRALVQRVSEAQVRVDEIIQGRIDAGFLVFLGIGEHDVEDDLDHLVKKITQLRIFSDTEGKMNKSVIEIGGSLLIVSQFTLFASTKKGTRPSFIKSAKPEIAIPLYDRFVEKCNRVLPVSTGIFGADMKVSLVNDGPVTIWLDSKERDY